MSTSGRTAAVPAELTDAIRAAGATGWTIWRSGTDLFHLIDCADYPAMLAALNANPVNVEWQARMAELFDAPHDYSAADGRRRRASGGMAALTVIDAHHHVWDLGVRDQPWIAYQEMAAIRRTFTVDTCGFTARAAGVGATAGRADGLDAGRGDAGTARARGGLAYLIAASRSAGPT